MTNDRNSEVHLLGAFCHGMLVFGHLLGVAYNIQRRNRLDIIMHIGGVAYSMKAVRHHLKEAHCGT